MAALSLCLDKLAVSDDQQKDVTLFYFQHHYASVYPVYKLFLYVNKTCHKEQMAQ